MVVVENTATGASTNDARKAPTLSSISIGGTYQLRSMSSSGGTGQRPSRLLIAFQAVCMRVSLLRRHGRPSKRLPLLYTVRQRTVRALLCDSCATRGSSARQRRNTVVAHTEHSSGDDALPGGSRSRATDQSVVDKHSTVRGGTSLSAIAISLPDSNSLPYQLAEVEVLHANSNGLVQCTCPPIANQIVDR